MVIVVILFVVILWKKRVLLVVLRVLSVVWIGFVMVCMCILESCSIWSRGFWCMDMFCICVVGMSINLC